MRPYREIRPYVGFRPTTPHSDAGWRTEPPVSVPRAHTTSPAATAAAEPPEDPPGTRSRSHGFRTGPNAVVSPDRRAAARSWPDRSQSSVTSGLLHDPGDLEPPLLGLGGGAEGFLVGESRPRLVGPVHVRPGDGVGRRWDVVGGHLADLL